MRGGRGGGESRACGPGRHPRRKWVSKMRRGREDGSSGLKVTGQRSRDRGRGAEGIHLVTPGNPQRDWTDKS